VIGDAVTVSALLCCCCFGLAFAAGLALVWGADLFLLLYFGVVCL
jgi:hypothetical protein